MNDSMRTFKAAMLYTRECGKAAYQAWLAREAEITEMAKTGKLPHFEICKLREDNFRHMKAEGARRAASMPSRDGSIRFAA